VIVRFRLFVAFFVVVALAACGGAAAPNGSATGNGYVRFLNGSPDQTAVDFDLPAGTRYIPDLNYKALTSYQTIAAGTYSVGATPVGSTNAFTYTTGGAQYTAVNNNFVVEANHRYTIVLGGSLYNSNLLLCTFNEQTFETASTAAAVQFNNCSPTNSSTTGTLTVGYYAPSPAPAASPVALQQMSVDTNSGIFNLPKSATNGIGFYAASPTNGTLLPVQLDPNDTTNALPFVSDQNVSAFILDGPIGTSNVLMIGALDPDN